MFGMRSAELAAGEATKVLGRVWQHSLAELMSDLDDLAVRPEEWARLQDMLSVGKSYLEAGLQQALDYYQRLPHILCGINHHDEDCDAVEFRRAQYCFRNSKCSHKCTQIYHATLRGNVLENAETDVLIHPIRIGRCGCQYTGGWACVAVSQWSSLSTTIARSQSVLHVCSRDA